MRKAKPTVLRFDLFMAGKMPPDRLITSYDFAEINCATADATSGMTIKPVLRLRH